MDSFEINKIIASILLVALLIIGISKISNVIYHVEKPNKSAYLVEANTESSSGTKAVATVDISALLSMGDADHGKTVSYTHLRAHET